MAEHRICDKCEWGKHISLTCKNHPNLKWSTKNIDDIGCRSIFYFSPELGPECSCPASDLVHIHENKPNDT